MLLPIAPDEPQALRRLIEEGLKADLLLMTGGVSMGRYDLVEQVLAELRAEFFFTGAKIQPGRPVVFGKCAAQATGRRSIFFWTSRESRFHHGDLRTFRPPYAGSTRRHVPAQIALCLCEAEVRNPRKARPEALPAGNPIRRIRRHSEVEIVRWQGSGDMAATACANCYVVSWRTVSKSIAGE